MAGEKALFNHLLFSAEAYREYIGLLKQTNDRDSNDGIFLYEQGLFSYLYAEDYLKIIEKTGFNINLMHLQYSNAAFRFLSGHPGEKVKIIEKYGVVFDLYCGGINIWARKIGARETL